VLAFIVNENHFPWKVGNGVLVRVGVDSILGCGESVILSQEIINKIQVRCIFTLNQVGDPNATTIWK
jgi:hypothetical protein